MLFTHAPWSKANCNRTARYHRSRGVNVELDREAAQEHAELLAEEITGEERTTVKAMPDEQLDGEVDRWSRK